MSAEDDIRELITSRIEAVRSKNVDGTRAVLAPEVVMFDVLAPLRYSGADEVGERTAKWFSSFATPIGYEVRDLAVFAADDVAFGHYLYRVSGTLASGDAVRMWVRATLGFRKIDGRWRIVHEHDSVPFDPETRRAVFDGDPE